MSKDLIPLVDLLNSKKGFDEDPKYVVAYKPDEKSINISNKSVGILPEEEKFFEIPKQTFQTEEFVYYPILDENNNPFLISKGITKNMLYVCGDGDNLDSLILAMKQICSLYSSKKLNAKGELITKELIKMLPSYLIKTEYEYFIDETLRDNIEYYGFNYPIARRNAINFPVGKVEIHDYYLFTCINNKIHSCRVSGYQASSCLIAASIRPVIRLPKEIMIDTSEISGKKLTLYKK